MHRLLRPFPWRQLGHLSLGIVLAPLQGVVLAAVAVTIPLTVFTPRPFLGLARVFAGLIALERERFTVLHDRAPALTLTLPARTRPPIERVRDTLRDPGFRRAAGYVVVRFTLAALDVVALSLVVTLPSLLLVAQLAAVVFSYQPLAVLYLSDAKMMLLANPVAAVIVLTVAAPALIRGLAWLDGWVSQALLGSPESAALARRVGELVEARTLTVTSADAERTRLERDLHDGAQQRLIALSILLGQAETRLASEPDTGTLALVRRARVETSGTIDELRTLTRGLRPPILEARGLDAALSAVAARLPMPVTIETRIDRRPDPAIEAMCYFAVAELLTNVAKHAAGAAASVDLVRDRTLIRATVTDAGPGGAEVTGGTGLSGIAHRLTGVDGRLFLSSPPGGPTVVTVEVPCG
ncbi:histidine kinase [Micropruina sp.]|uniref:sensor histidine kinase n=1 Tax=Micropruina sp. TaxID=2737536 RepID=UPI0026039EB6|nr:histidine kinase [Micropruina sp.]